MPDADQAGTVIDAPLNCGRFKQLAQRGRQNGLDQMVIETRCPSPLSVFFLSPSGDCDEERAFEPGHLTQAGQLIAGLALKFIGRPLPSPGAFGILVADLLLRECHRRVDESGVRERLWKIPEQTARMRVVFLRQQPHVVLQRE